MQKLLLAMPIAALVLLATLAAAVACGSGTAQETSDGVTEVSLEESRQIARNYLLESPTYKFDGIEGSLKEVAVNTMRCPYCWEFVFEFQCRQAGHGDRTGQVLLQVITDHTAKVVVQEGEVISAIEDDEWDIMTQRFLDSE
ncbi:MAG: hypothetical protein ACUVV3_10490 [Dehalococcoidia bacterium]